MTPQTRDLPAVGDFVFVHDTGRHRPEYVTGIVHHHNDDNVVTLLVLHSSGLRSVEYTPYSLYSWTPNDENSWVRLDGGASIDTPPVTLHNIGLTTRAFEILDSVVFLKNGAQDANVGVFVNIEDWRHAINLLGETL